MSLDEEIWTQRLYEAVDEHPAARDFNVATYLADGRRRVRRNRIVTDIASVAAVVTVLGGLAVVNQDKLVERLMPPATQTPTPTPSPTATSSPVRGNSTADDVVDNPTALNLGWAVSPEDANVRASVWSVGDKTALAYTRDGFVTRTTHLVPGLPSEGYVSGFAGDGALVYNVYGVELSGEASLPWLINQDGTVVRPRLSSTPAPLVEGEFIADVMVENASSIEGFDTRAVAIDPATGRAHPLPQLPVDGIRGLGFDTTIQYVGGTTLHLVVSGAMPGRSGPEAGYWRSTDGGNTWIQTPLEGLEGEIWPIAWSPGSPILLEEDVYASSGRSKARFGWRSTDGGAAFERFEGLAGVTYNRVTLAAGVLPDGRLCLATQAGLQVSDGDDWSTMLSVPDSPSTELEIIYPTATGVVVAESFGGTGRWLFDGETVAPLVLR